MTDSLPPDPWGPSEEMISLMGGMRQLHSAAMASGFPEHVASQVIAGILYSMMSSNAQQAPPPEA